MMLKSSCPTNFNSDPKQTESEKILSMPRFESRYLERMMDPLANSAKPPLFSIHYFDVFKKNSKTSI
jgi:hypothetical protein